MAEENFNVAINILVDDEPKDNLKKESNEIEKNGRSSIKRKPGDFSFMNFMKKDFRSKRAHPYKPDKFSNGSPDSGNQVLKSDSNGSNSQKLFIKISSSKDTPVELEESNEAVCSQKIKPVLAIQSHQVINSNSENNDATVDNEISDTKIENVTISQNSKSVDASTLSINEEILRQYLYGNKIPAVPDDQNCLNSPQTDEKVEEMVELDKSEEEEVEYNYNHINDSEAVSFVDYGLKKMEFDVLDDLNEEDFDEDENSHNDYWEDSDKTVSDTDEIPEEEIDAMLDQKLEEYQKHRKFAYEDEEQPHEQREKVVLKARGNDHFEVLPEGWIEVTHSSGMPIYLHKQTRVCTLSKPYFLGPGSARKHQVPITAIPCLHYRRELNKEREINNKMEKAFEENLLENISEEGSKSGKILPSAKIETVQENFKEKSIDQAELREYCQALFEFKTITVRRFKTWAGRRKHQQRIKQMHRPTLPSGTKLITCPLPPSSSDKDEHGNSNSRRAEFVMNPNGKSHVCILHEYVQHAMKVQPRYIFRELENASTPYGATVVINDMEYGSGFGSSKKYAKLHAAKATLEILIPQMKSINPDDKAQGIQQDLTFFDDVRVEDPRVSELCAKAGQPSPYQILLECLKRNYGMGDTQIRFETQTLKHQKNEFTMTVGKHIVKVVCKNKRDGKQRASQAILQAMHSHISSWGSLLRLYGKGSCKTLKEKKQEEQQITELQCRTTANRPNQLILDKLRDELLKLKRNKDLMKPIGKFVPTDVEPPSQSGCNLKNVDL